MVLGLLKGRFHASGDLASGGCSHADNRKGFPIHSYSVRQYFSDLWDNYKMRQNLIIFLNLILVAFGLVPATHADTANPPKILKITQITKGPYLPGDMIQFSVETSGGAPGLRKIQISSDCFNVAWYSDPKYDENIFPKGDFDSNFINEKLITGRIGGCRSKAYMASVSVLDQTLLSDGFGFRSSELNFEVKNRFLPPQGEVQPNPDFALFQSQDDISWNAFTNTGKDGTNVNQIDISKINELLILPSFTKLGQTIEWSDQNNNTCKIIRRFPGDVGNLKFLNSGTCHVFASVLYDGIKFNVGGSKRIGDGLGRYSFVINQKQVTTKKVVYCVKGKVIKKVSGINPKCPTGYKLK
jgi:hypothetical protein